MTSIDWWHLADCADLDTRLFFRENDASAKAVCSACRVREPCLHYAIVNNEYGIWGGLSREERKRLLKRWKRQNALATHN